MARTLALSLPEDLYKWLEEEAERENKTKQQIIREALEEVRALRRYRINRILNALELQIEELEYILEYLREQMSSPDDRE